MTDRPELDGLRRHDLPPSWDGRQVTWTGWVEQPWTTLVFHQPDHGACTGCGSLARLLTCRGMVTTEGVDHVLHTLQLTATRCPDCRLDHVVEHQHDGAVEVWTLDATDYGDSGSTPPPAAPVAERLATRPGRGVDSREAKARARANIRRLQTLDTPLDRT